MDNFLETFTNSLMIAILLFVSATIGGTLLWILYPHIHSLFPSAASTGVIAADLNWWNAVCVVWIFNIILPGAKSTVNKK